MKKYSISLPVCFATLGSWRSWPAGAALTMVRSRGRSRGWLFERDVGVLLYEQDRRSLMVDLLDGLEDAPLARGRGPWRVRRGRQFRTAHQGAADREHLLLAAGQSTGLLFDTLFRRGTVRRRDPYPRVPGTIFIGGKRPSPGFRGLSCGGRSCAPRGSGRCP